MGIFHFEVESKATSSWLNRNLGVLSLRIFRLSCSKDEEHSCLVLDFFSNCLGYSHDILWFFYLCTEGMMVMSQTKKTSCDSEQVWIRSLKLFLFSQPHLPLYIQVNLPLWFQHSKRIQIKQNLWKLMTSSRISKDDMHNIETASNLSNYFLPTNEFQLI